MLGIVGRVHCRVLPLNLLPNKSTLERIEWPRYEEEVIEILEQDTA